jgi:hypothetical protein
MLDDRGGPADSAGKASPNPPRGARSEQVFRTLLRVIICALAVASGMAMPAGRAGAGTTWSIVPSPNVGSDGNDLYAVACVSPNACTAVGDYHTGSAYQTLVESWNGSVWSVVLSPNVALSDNYLYAVSCLSASACTAVGRSNDSSVVDHTLVESWNGSTWSIASSLDTSPSLNNLFKGVSCVSSI